MSITCNLQALRQRAMTLWTIANNSTDAATRAHAIDAILDISARTGYCDPFIEALTDRAIRLPVILTPH